MPELDWANIATVIVALVGAAATAWATTRTARSAEHKAELHERSVFRGDLLADIANLKQEVDGLRAQVTDLHQENLRLQREVHELTLRNSVLEQRLAKYELHER